MIANKTRDSFLSVAEILQEAAQQGHNAELALRTCLYRVVEPYSLAFKEIADIERDLAGVLFHFAENGPENVLQTRFQYTLDTEQPKEPVDPFHAVDVLTRINQQIIEDLDEHARKVTLDSVGGALEMLRREVETLARKISMIRFTMQDV